MWNHPIYMLCWDSTEAGNIHNAVGCVCKYVQIDTWSKLQVCPRSQWKCLTPAGSSQYEWWVQNLCQTSLVHHTDVATPSRAELKRDLYAVHNNALFFFPLFHPLQETTQSSEACMYRKIFFSSFQFLKWLIEYSEWYLFILCIYSWLYFIVVCSVLKHACLSVTAQTKNIYRSD